MSHFVQIKRDTRAGQFGKPDVVVLWLVLYLRRRMIITCRA